MSNVNHGNNGRSTALRIGAKPSDAGTLECAPGARRTTETVHLLHGNPWTEAQKNPESNSSVYISDEPAVGTRARAESEVPRPRAPATFRRIGSVVAALAFVSGLAMVVARWLNEPIDVYRAFLDIPRVSVRSPAAGTGSIRAAVGEYVEHGATIASVSLPEAEQSRLGREKHALANQASALEARRDAVVARIEGLQYQHASLLDAQEAETVARLGYESVRDNGIEPFEEGLNLLEEATRVSTGLSDRLHGLLEASLASSVEASEASLRALSYQLHRAAVARDNGRVDALSQAADRLREVAHNRTELQKSEVLSPEILQEVRLLEQIDFDLTNVRNQSRILDATPTEYSVPAPCSGRVAYIEAGTYSHAGDELMTVDCSSEVRIRVQLSYDALRRILGRHSEVAQFRLTRTNKIVEARIVAVQKGLVERDRRLRRLDLVEVLLLATTSLPEAVPGENVELLE